MRVLVGSVQTPFLRGGAEMLADNLVDALRLHGHAAELVTMPFKWYPASNIPDAMLLARLLELDRWSGGPVDRMIGLKFPATLMRHPHKILWLLHQYRGAYDLWDAPDGDLGHVPDGRAVRDAIRAADDATFAECRAIHTISRVVSARLARFNGVESSPLHHPPPHAELYRPGPVGDVFLCPGRVNPTKRQHLVVEAAGRSVLPVRVVFIGPEEDAAYAASLRARADALGIADRLSWRGVVPEHEKRALFAAARAVIVPPRDEDYGYVALEAMLAARSVVTCTDAGGPLDFVVDGVTGSVCAPDAASLAGALALHAADRALAAARGAAGRDRYATLGLDWALVVERLLD